MDNIPNEILEKITKWISLIDFEQPHAHRVLAEIKDPIDKMMGDPKKISWKIYRWFNLGYRLGFQEALFYNIPPVTEWK